MYEIDLTLAGVPFRVTLDGPCVPAHIDARFGPYRSDRAGLAPSAPPATLHVEVRPGWEPAERPSVEFPGAEGALLDDGTVRFLRTTDEVRWNPQTRHGEALRVHVPQTLPPVVDATPIDTPLRLVLSHDLPTRDGLLVHGAGYADDRGAVAFLAPTRGGKTTTSRKLPEAHVLSDDQVALRRIDGVWHAYALPFVGEYGRATVPRVAKLRALVLLEKSPTLSLSRVASPRALARVMHCVVRFVRGAGGAAVLGLSADLVAAVPVYALALSRDEPVMPVIEGLL